jgi:hypothetical protein
MMPEITAPVRVLVPLLELATFPGFGLSPFLFRTSSILVVVSSATTLRNRKGFRECEQRISC